MADTTPMEYPVRTYRSPYGLIYMTADEQGLTGLWFEGQRHAILPTVLREVDRNDEDPLWRDVCRWLDLYFSGEEPGFTPPLHLKGTPFRQAVWALLLEIPYGETTSYGNLARKLATLSGRKVAAQAVGNAVGHNPVSLIVPCHRVLGSNGAMVGYAGGIWRKEVLLALEQNKNQAEPRG